MRQVFTWRFCFFMNSNCVIDIGNTRIKMGLFKDDHLIEQHSFDGSHSNHLVEYLHQVESTHCILSSTQKENAELIQLVKERFKTVILNEYTPLPIAIDYESPESLGDDRKAAVVGAHFIQPETTLLVITCGTCLTYNYFDGQAFVGGAISPGIHLRYRSMHDYTGNLPLVNNNPFNELIGRTTQESLQSGVQNGILAEVDGMIDKYLLLDSELSVFLCGGDTNFFVSRLKNKIFAHPNLVLHGLNQILEYNIN